MTSNWNWGSNFNGQTLSPRVQLTDSCFVGDFLKCSIAAKNMVLLNFDPVKPWYSDHFSCNDLQGLCQMQTFPQTSPSQPTRNYQSIILFAQPPNHGTTSPPPLSLKIPSSKLVAPHHFSSSATGRSGPSPRPLRPLPMPADTPQARPRRMPSAPRHRPTPRRPGPHRRTTGCPPRARRGGWQTEQHLQLSWEIQLFQLELHLDLLQLQLMLCQLQVQLLDLREVSHLLLLPVRWTYPVHHLSQTDKSPFLPAPVAVAEIRGQVPGRPRSHDPNGRWWRLWRLCRFPRPWPVWSWRATPPPSSGASPSVPRHRPRSCRRLRGSTRCRRDRPSCHPQVVSVLPEAAPPPPQSCWSSQGVDCHRPSISRLPERSARYMWGTANQGPTLSLRPSEALTWLWVKKNGGSVDQVGKLFWGHLEPGLNVPGLDIFLTNGVPCDLHVVAGMKNTCRWFNLFNLYSYVCVDYISNAPDNPNQRITRLNKNFPTHAPEKTGIQTPGSSTWADLQVRWTWQPMWLVSYHIGMGQNVVSNLLGPREHTCLRMDSDEASRLNNVESAPLATFLGQYPSMTTISPIASYHAHITAQLAVADLYHLRHWRPWDPSLPNQPQ